MSESQPDEGVALWFKSLLTGGLALLDPAVSTRQEVWDRRMMGLDGWGLVVVLYRVKYVNKRFKMGTLLTRLLDSFSILHKRASSRNVTSDPDPEDRLQYRPLHLFAYVSTVFKRLLVPGGCPLLTPIDSEEESRVFGSTALDDDP